MGFGTQYRQVVVIRSNESDVSSDVKRREGMISLHPAIFLLLANSPSINFPRYICMVSAYPMKAMKRESELTSPVLSSTVMICPKDSCRSLIGTPRFAMLSKYPYGPVGQVMLLESCTLYA